MNVWGDCSKTRADKLQKLQNRAARIITRADYSIRSSDVLNSLEWSNLEERRKRHLLVAMFKIFDNDCPTYLREQFHRTSEIHDYLDKQNKTFKFEKRHVSATPVPSSVYG